MKYYSLMLSAAVLLAVQASAAEPARIVLAAFQEITPSLEPPIEELRKLVGQEAEVTFTVMDVGGRSNLFLNSQKNWRQPDCFSIMLLPAAREELKKLGTDDPFDDLIGRQVRCRGRLEPDGDRVRIVVRDFAKQFELLGPGLTDGKKPAGSVPSTAAATSAAATVAAPVNSTDPFIQPSIEELRSSVGKEVDVTFRVMNAGGRTHLYINSEQNYRQPDCFTAQVMPDVVADFGALGLQDPRTELIGKLLECHGKVELNDDRLNIVVTDVKNQLKIVAEPGEPATPAEETPGTP